MSKLPCKGPSSVASSSQGLNRADSQRGSFLLPALTREPIQMHPDMRCVRGSPRKRDGAAEGVARLTGPAELNKERAPKPMEMEVALEPDAKRLDQGKRRLGAAHLGD